MRRYEGQLLFDTHDEVEHLALIERIVGRFPSSVARRAKCQHLHFCDFSGVHMTSSLMARVSDGLKRRPRLAALSL